MAIVLTGDARYIGGGSKVDIFDGPGQVNSLQRQVPADFEPLPAALRGERVERATEAAQIFIMKVRANHSGFAFSYIFGTNRRSFVVTTGATTAVALPAYGDERYFQGLLFGPEETRRDIGYKSPWYVPGKLKVQINYGESIPDFVTIDSASPSTISPHALAWEGQDLVAPRLLYTRISQERRDNRSLFYAGVLLGIAGAFLVAAIQALFSR